MEISGMHFTRADEIELVNLYHLARTALSGQDDGRWARMHWAATEYAKTRPECPVGRAYKVLERSLA
jgi:hypothetical protein